MSAGILEELTVLLKNIPIPVETGVFGGIAPDEYAVITPMDDVFEVFGDNLPLFESREARISIFSKNNYRRLVNRVVRALLSAGFIVTKRTYVDREDDTGYFHYAVDAAKEYYFNMKEDVVYGSDRA